MFMNTANEVVILITGLLGLISAGVGVYFAVKNWFKLMKTKNKQEVWKLLIEMADKAMEEAERSGKAGEDKKEMVLDAIEAAAEAAGIETGEFFTQLDLYIDQTIDFVKRMKKASEVAASAQE